MVLKGIDGYGDECRVSGVGGRWAVVVVVVVVAVVEGWNGECGDSERQAAR